jgi:hypothetical protein
MIRRLLNYPSRAWPILFISVERNQFVQQRETALEALVVKRLRSIDEIGDKPHYSDW